MFLAIYSLESYEITETSRFLTFIRGTCLPSKLLWALKQQEMAAGIWTVVARILRIYFSGTRAHTQQAADRRRHYFRCKPSNVCRTRSYSQNTAVKCFLHANSNVCVRFVYFGLWFHNFSLSWHSRRLRVKSSHFIQFRRGGRVAGKSGNCLCL